LRSARVPLIEEPWTPREVSPLVNHTFIGAPLEMTAPGRRKRLQLERPKPL